MKDNLDLIAKMLRKAEGTDNEAEATAFMERAQTLATRYSIDLAMARSHTAKAEKREEVEEQRIPIGDKGKNGLATYVRLFIDLGTINNVRCLIQSDSTAVYAMGFPSDIELTKALYASLVVQMIEAGDAYIKSGAYKAETISVPGHYKKVYCEDGEYGGRYLGWGRGYERSYDRVWVDGKQKPVDGRVARREFHTGFKNRVVARLRAASEQAVQAAEAESDQTMIADENGQALTSMALVLREKSKEVGAFMEARMKRDKIRGSWKGGRGATGSALGARSAGQAAGNSARLGGAKGISAGRTSIDA